MRYYQTMRTPAPRITVKCAHCGHKFTARVSRNRKFCGKLCADEHYKQARQAQYTERACLECGAKFKRQPARKDKYCGVTCRQRAMGKRAGALNIKRHRGKGKKHPYIKYYGQHLHRVIAAQKLGRALKPGEVVHHIDGNPRNNDPDNIIVLKNQGIHARIHHTKNRAMLQDIEAGAMME